MIILIGSLLALSVIVNILLIWYIKKMLKELLFNSDNIFQLQVSMSDFSLHLEGIQDQETYYGDPTIEGLIKHSKEITEEIKDFKDVYSTNREEIREDLIDEEQNDKEN